MRKIMLDSPATVNSTEMITNTQPKKRKLNVKLKGVSCPYVLYGEYASNTNVMQIYFLSCKCCRVSRIAYILRHKTH